MARRKSAGWRHQCLSNIQPAGFEATWRGMYRRRRRSLWRQRKISGVIMWREGGIFMAAAHRRNREGTSSFSRLKMAAARLGVGW
jgi:hypothetical protein